MYDVAIIGGGIIGTAAAAYLAEAGASVVLLEWSALGAGASGRNSGGIQHPYDPILARLHDQTLLLYRELADTDPDFRLAGQPDGLLLVSTDPAGAESVATELNAATPELEALFVPPDELAQLEPGLAPNVAGVLLATGYAVAPAAATHAFARRATRAGAEVRVGQQATVEAGFALAGSVLVAAGPWSGGLVPGWTERTPIGRLWGVVATIDMAQPPRHILEEMSIDAHGSADPVAFSLMTADGSTSLGSTFLLDEPEPAEIVEQLRSRGTRFVPAVGSATVSAFRVCARPVAFDGRPLIGPVAGVERLYVCAGHGPWGISAGPASARLVVDAILGRAVDLPAELSASRIAT